MNHLVLGSSGQIGSSLCDYLRHSGNSVVTFDIVDSEEEEDLRKESAYLEQCISEADFIYFLAFDVGGARYLQQHQNKSEFMINNMRLMSNVFDVISRHRKPFLFASSQMADMKHSTYGSLKYLGEKITSDLKGTIIRFWNVYGAEKDLNKAHVITDFILKAKNNKEIEMMTDGQESRQFLHATDCSRCLYTISQSPQNFSNKSFDVTSFEWTKIVDVAHIISSLLGDAKVIPGTKKDQVQKAIKVPPHKEILEHWTPQISLEDGIADIIHLMEKDK
jgi:nucleoside-diphosphate-sugar epimerase